MVSGVRNLARVCNVLSDNINRKKYQKYYTWHKRALFQRPLLSVRLIIQSTSCSGILSLHPSEFRRGRLRTKIKFVSLHGGAFKFLFAVGLGEPYLVAPAYYRKKRHKKIFLLVNEFIFKKKKKEHNDNKKLLYHKKNVYTTTHRYIFIRKKNLFSNKMTCFRTKWFFFAQLR